MLNTENQRVAAIPRKSKAKPPLRSYLRLNVASFFVAALLLAFVTFQVATNVAQRLETPQTADSSSTSGQNNALIVPPMANSTTSGTDNSASNSADNSNSSAANSSNGTSSSSDNSNQNNSGGFFGGSVQVNPPSFSMPSTGHS